MKDFRLSKSNNQNILGNLLYVLSYLDFKNPKFHILAYAFDKNPNLIRNLLVKLSKGSFIEIIKAIDSEDKIGLDWAKRMKFLELQTKIGNLPKNFMFSKR